MHGKSIIFLVNAIFFHATMVTKNHSKDPQRNENNQGIDIIYRTALFAGLRPSTSISQYEIGITAFYFLFYMESHMPLASAIATGAFQWISYVILTKFLSNIINLKQVERITCKNVFLLLSHKFLKRFIYIPRHRRQNFLSNFYNIVMPFVFYLIKNHRPE